MKYVADGVLHNINLLEVFLLPVMISLACKSLSECRSSGCHNQKGYKGYSFHQQILTDIKLPNSLNGRPECRLLIVLLQNVTANSRQSPFVLLFV